jgi:HEAT repeat protein
MTRIWTVLQALVVIALAGCGQTHPTLAGGKPVSFWIDSLQNSDARLRQKAVDKLGNVGNSDPQAFPAVIGALRDADPAVRQAAVRAVPKFGAHAREAVAALKELESSDADPEIRSEAATVRQALEANP